MLQTLSSGAKLSFEDRIRELKIWRGMREGQLPNRRARHRDKVEASLGIWLDKALQRRHRSIGKKPSQQRLTSNEKTLLDEAVGDRYDRPRASKATSQDESAGYMVETMDGHIKKHLYAAIAEASGLQLQVIKMCLKVLPDVAAKILKEKGILNLHNFLIVRMTTIDARDYKQKRGRPRKYNAHHHRYALQQSHFSLHIFRSCYKRNAPMPYAYAIAFIWFCMWRIGIQANAAKIYYQS